MCFIDLELVVSQPSSKINLFVCKQRCGPWKVLNFLKPGLWRRNSNFRIWIRLQAFKFLISGFGSSIWKFLAPDPERFGPFLHSFSCRFYFREGPGGSSPRGTLINSRSTAISGNSADSTSRRDRAKSEM